MRAQPFSLLPLLFVLALLCLGHGGGGCGEDASDAHHHEDRASGATCPQDGGPTEQDFGRAFLEAYCLSCHSASIQGPSRGGAPEDMNFDSPEDVRRHAEAIDAHSAAGSTITNTDMPPAYSPQPTQEERRKLGQWLACGAR